jgi:hypothetical protein
LRLIEKKTLSMQTKVGGHDQEIVAQENEENCI